MPARDIEFGLDSAACVSVDQSGRNLSGDVVVRNTVEEAVLADSVGIDSFNIAEHYRPDFMDSAGHVILAAIAARTERIRLGTAVTVLRTQDPVRVYAEFATLDLAYALGRVPHEQRMAAIELYGREVIPRVRELLAADVRETADQK